MENADRRTADSGHTKEIFSHVRIFHFSGKREQKVENANTLENARKNASTGTLRRPLSYLQDGIPNNHIS